VARGIPSDVIRHFQAVPLFASVSKKGIRALVQAADEVDLAAGKVLVREGEWGRHLYVILRGTAVVTKEGKKLRELVPGDFFGEIAFLSGAPRYATITARTDMRVMILGPPQLEVIMDQEPVLARRMLETMARRVHSNENVSHTH
jgi:CRP/FNR family transcriptional regulator, cyclic AMP receptor protein